jgi:hypothetical protein
MIVDHEAYAALHLYELVYPVLDQLVLYDLLNLGPGTLQKCLLAALVLFVDPTSRVFAICASVRLAK